MAQPLNRGIASVFYLGWFFVWIVFLFPEMQTRITALELAGNMSGLVVAIPFIILLIALAVPVYMILEGEK